jgi:hypothetical protein
MNTEDWETIEKALISYSWAKYGNEINEELEELIQKVRGQSQ